MPERAIRRFLTGIAGGFALAAIWVLVPEGYLAKALAVALFSLCVGFLFGTMDSPLRKGLLLSLVVFFPMALYGLDVSRAVAVLAVLAIPVILLMSGVRRGKWMWAALGLMLAGAIGSRALTFLGSGAMLPWQGDLLFMTSLALIPIAFVVVSGGWITLRQIAVALGVSGACLASFSIGLAAVTGKLFSERLGLTGVINPNVLACYLDMTMPLAFMLFFHERRVVLKISALGLAMIQFMAIVLAQTRGSVPGYLLLLGTFVFLIRKRVMLLASLFLISLPVIAMAGMKILQRISNPDSNDSASNLGRLGLLKVAFEVLRDHNYLVGIGMDNFKKVKESYGFPRWFDQTMMMSSHDAHLEFYLGWGALGIVGWIALLGGALVGAWKRWMASSDHLALGLVLSLTAFSLHGLVESLIASPPFLAILCMLLGVAYGVACRDVDVPSDIA